MFVPQSKNDRWRSIHQPWLSHYEARARSSTCEVIGAQQQKTSRAFALAPVLIFFLVFGREKVSIDMGKCDWRRKMKQLHRSVVEGVIKFRIYLHGKSKYPGTSTLFVTWKSNNGNRLQPTTINNYASIDSWYCAIWIAFTRLELWPINIDKIG